MALEEPILDLTLTYFELTWLLLNYCHPISRVNSVLVIATSTSNHSILLTRSNLAPSIVYMKQILYEATSLNVSQDNVCLILHIFITNNLLPFSSPLTQARWLTGTMLCQRATHDFVPHFLFSKFTVNLHIWRPFPYVQPGYPVDGSYHLHTTRAYNWVLILHNLH